MLGSTALKQFIEAVILCPTYAGALLIGHCMSRFDGQLLLEALVEHGVEIKSLQARGMKLMGVVVGPFSMKLKDSFLLFPTSLSKFCQAMEVEGEKGFCPILANSATALSRPSGRCPARRHFVVPKERQAEFEIFFTDRRSRKGYNFKRELVAYCVQDVRLLWMACEKFRSMIEKQLGVRNIFNVSTTTASAAMFIFRLCFMPRQSIAILSEHMAQHYNSALSYIFTDFLNKTMGYRFQHGASGQRGERKIYGRMLDGWDEERQVMLTVLGCEVGTNCHVPVRPRARSDSLLSACQLRTAHISTMPNTGSLAHVRKL
jgi:hypothetical protein